MRHLPLREFGYAFGFLAVLLALYVGAFCALVEFDGSISMDSEGPPKFRCKFTTIHYRWGGPSAEQVFAPMLALHFRLRYPDQPGPDGVLECCEPVYLPKMSRHDLVAVSGPTCAHFVAASLATPSACLRARCCDYGEERLLRPDRRRRRCIGDSASTVLRHGRVRSPIRVDEWSHRSSGNDSVDRSAVAISGDGHPHRAEQGKNR